MASHFGWPASSAVLANNPVCCLYRWVGWYPQLVQNYLAKTVVGISFDFAIYNFIGFICYSSFNCALFFNPHIRKEYRCA